MKNFKQQLKDLLEKEGLKCTIEETDNGLLVVEKEKRWRAKHGGLYSFVADNGIIKRTNDDFGTTDEYRYDTHNYFKTEREALDSHANGLKSGQLKDYLIELKHEGRCIKFNFLDSTVKDLVKDKFGNFDFI
jgi:hypothetical protein